MSRNKVFMGVGLLLVLSILAAHSFSQDEQGQPARGRRGGQGPAGAQGQMAAPGERPSQMGQRDPEQMRQMMQERQMQRVKQALKPTDEQWTKIESPLKKVLNLSQQERGMGLAGRAMAGRGQRPGGPEGQPDQPMPEPETKIEKARLELRTALDGTDQSAIEAKLAAFRAARDEAKKELDEAKKELKKQVTPAQEAELVLMGYLD